MEHPRLSPPAESAGYLREWTTVAAPEVQEVLTQPRRFRPPHAHMGVAPASPIKLADVIAAEEGDLAIHDQQLPMVARVAAEVQHMPGAGKRSVRQHVYPAGKLFEPAGDHQIGEVIIDDIDLDPGRRLRRQGLLELDPEPITLLDIGFQEDGTACLADSSQHILKEPVPRTIQFERIAVDFHFLERNAGKA